MTTRVTEDARRERHGCRPRFSRLAASSLNARARVHLLNLKKKRGCSQSRLDCNIYSFYCTFLKFFPTHSTFSTLRAPYFSPNMSLFISVGTTIIFGNFGQIKVVADQSRYTVMLYFWGEQRDWRKGVRCGNVPVKKMSIISCFKRLTCLFLLTGRTYYTAPTNTYAGGPMDPHFGELSFLHLSTSSTSWQTGAFGSKKTPIQFAFIGAMDCVMQWFIILESIHKFIITLFTSLRAQLLLGLLLTKRQPFEVRNDRHFL